MARGKRYRQAYEQIDRTRLRPGGGGRDPEEPPAPSFDETVELHIKLGVNVRHAEEQLRGTLALPRGLGKDVTIAVFAEGEQPGRRPRPAPSSSAPTTSPSASRAAGRTSTSRSRRPR